ncbi:MAG: DNA-protecting protein DprA [Gammaproteobacteria bacterium]|nr:DNA-protecting protein DprA [Gammaproteobacteria bacterium]
MSPFSSPHEAWLRLVHASGIGNSRLLELIGAFGTVEAVVAASRAELRRRGLTETTITAISAPDAKRLEKDLVWLDSPSHHLLPITSPEYPALLREIPDPPPALFVNGMLDALPTPQIAIVGSRNPTPAGAENAFEFARHLSACGLTITSGLALGIDAAAHRGALAGPGRTVAVCGTGADRVYPARNRSLATEIVRTGALVSEFPPGTPPLREHFPQRNRIISGLALGTLVVEAAERSGSLITARLAGEQSREVFAIPGSIHNPLARGCHKLIRQGAKLVESAADIFEELSAIAGALADSGQALQRVASDSPRPSPDRDESYELLLEALGFEPAPVDRLVERTGLTATELSSMLLILELEGHVRSVPGGAYSRVRS